MKVVDTGRGYRIYGDDLQVHDQLPVDVYIVRFHPMQGFYLDKYSGLEVNEEKIYGVHIEKVAKVLTSFNRFERSLGVILSGDKGIGKSLFSRVLCQSAMKEGYPVIVVDSFSPGIHYFLEEIEQEVVVLFDEFDKKFSDSKARNGDDSGPTAQTSLLSLFDGTSAGKKLYIITCNKFHSLNEYLINRPGRFHYHFRFGYPTANEVEAYLKDKVEEQYWGEIPKVINFAGKVELNFDCLRAIAYEIQSGVKFEDAILDLNILNLNDQQYDITLYLKDGEKFVQKDFRFDLFSNSETEIWCHGRNHSMNVSFIPANAYYDAQRRCNIIDVSDLEEVRLRNSEDEDEPVDKELISHLEIKPRERQSFRYIL